MYHTLNFLTVVSPERGALFTRPAALCCRNGFGRQAIDKFGGRWRALKPQEMKDWSAPEVERVFAALGDWREQFAEHKTKVWWDGTAWDGMGREGRRGSL